MVKQHRGAINLAVTYRSMLLLFAAPFCSNLLPYARGQISRLRYEDFFFLKSQREDRPK